MTIQSGTRVENQTGPDDRMFGTVVGPVEGLPGWVHVRWDTGITTEEWSADITVLAVEDSEWPDPTIHAGGPQ